MMRGTFAVVGLPVAAVTRSRRHAWYPDGQAPRKGESPAVADGAEPEVTPQTWILDVERLTLDASFHP